MSSLEQVTNDCWDKSVKCSDESTQVKCLVSHKTSITCRLQTSAASLPFGRQPITYFIKKMEATAIPPVLSWPQSF